MADAPQPTGLTTRILRQLHPSHQHSAFAATVLLMATVTLSRIVGFLRETYIAWSFGAGAATDAYNAAFTLPDYLNHLVAGGTASITFISIYSRYIAAKREEEAERAFSIIVTIASTVLIAGIAVAEIFAVQITQLLFPKFSPEQVELCARLTRILLPAQLFFYVGGVVAAVLTARRTFLLPSLAPVLYNVGIIGGGVLLGGQMGIASLAVGALAGAFIGPFLINAIGVARTHLRYRPSFDWRHPAFREWVRMSVPLMLGVSIVAADDWIMRFFASGGTGDISRLNYAKRLFLVPVAIVGQAIGQASLPFFAKLWGEGKKEDFSRSVSRTVSNTAALSILGTAWLTSCALPIVDLAYRRGNFSLGDSYETANLLMIFSLTLAFWAIQGLYTRAFYAAGNTLEPMVIATAVIVISLPFYSIFDSKAQFHGLIDAYTYNPYGLAWASNLAIVLHTVGIAVIAHRRRLVLMQDLKWLELLKAIFIAIPAFWLSSQLFAASPPVLEHLHPQLEVAGQVRIHFIIQLAVRSGIWLAVVVAGLWLTRSSLLRELRRRKA